MSGSRNETLYGDNVDFSGAAIPAPTVTTDGQLLIGSTAAPNIRVGSLTSTGSTISITPGAGTINLEANGSTVGSTITGNTGGALSPTAGNWNIVGSVSAAGTTPVSTSGSVSTLTANVQTSQALAATDATKIGLCNFDSSSFAVDANGFVTFTGGGSSITLTGDTGTPITGSSLTVFANTATQNCGATVSFSNDGATTSTLNVSDGSGNTVIGHQSGITLGTGSNLTSLGVGNFTTVTNASDCVCIGNSAGNGITSGSNSVYVGNGAGFLNTTGTENVAIGTQALGYNGFITGSHNTTLGFNAGLNYKSTESSNILIGPVIGTVGENNVIRIGNQGSGSGQQNTTFIAGIASVSVSNTQMVTIDTSTGQMGSQAIPSSATTWTDESTSFAPAAGNGYFITGTTTATLPASPSQGNTISFAVDAATVLTIQANTGQVIRIGAAVSASAGTAASTARGDSVTLVYRSSDTAWIATSVIGTFTVT